MPECREKIDRLAHIFIVESIGDSMALAEHGIYNQLVNFGLDCSPALQGFLLEKNPDQITISTNNDDTKEKNSGKIAAIRIMMKMSGFFPIDRLKIKLPTSNDLSQMHQEGAQLNDWRHDPQLIMPLEEIVSFINEHPRYFDAEKTKKFLKRL